MSSIWLRVRDWFVRLLCEFEGKIGVDVDSAWGVRELNFLVRAWKAAFAKAQSLGCFRLCASLKGAVQYVRSCPALNGSR